ncbi:MAG: alcohol dehydrogenase catalytic domain-containing protein, partial [Chloroflexota bacterium]
MVYTEYGAPGVIHLAEVEKPTPKDNEVLIRVHATSATTGDVNARGFVFVPRGFGFLSRLAFGLGKPKKQILGLEFAGEIEAIGKNVTQFQKGDQVFGLDGVGLGAYAEYKCISESAGLATKPANLTFEEAAVIPNG